MNDIRGPIHRIRPVILGGGSGTRLWPISRVIRPKQLHAIGQVDTMLQATALRAHQAPFDRPIIIAGEDYRFLVTAQLADVGVDPECIILEPEPRNTAAAIAIAALLLEEADELMLAMPSDHIVRNVPDLIDALAQATPAAAAGAIVTFGVKPHSPETGFGYIEAGAPHPASGAVCLVKNFVEKPDELTAGQLATSGRHYWNSGMFLMRASVFLSELRLHAPAIESACRQAMADRGIDGIFVRPAREWFVQSPNISIDYAVMERTDKACVVPVDLDWSDVGSWNSLWDISDKDGAGNVVSGDTIAIDSQNSLLRNDTGLLLAAVGVEDMVVIATKDAVLIVPRNRTQDTRLVVDELKRAQRDIYVDHSQVVRPWGSYEVMDRGDRFQTKRIIVKPGEKLSLQTHKHRSEHWIVVSGVARVTIGDEITLLNENQSTYVPVGCKHRLENPGPDPLHLVEVQCGSYLGEDDIIRFDDDYGRAPAPRKNAHVTDSERS